MKWVIVFYSNLSLYLFVYCSVPQYTYYSASHVRRQRAALNRANLSANQSNSTEELHGLEVVEDLPMDFVQDVEDIVQDVEADIVQDLEQEFPVIALEDLYDNPHENGSAKRSSICWPIAFSW